MRSVLVTGGTGTLGKDVVRRLADEHHEVTVLTRRADGEPGPFLREVGDLTTGMGLSAAVEGVEAIVHCATGTGDVEATRRLVAAARRSGQNPHLVYVSIVGIDHIGLPYYRTKLAAEQVVAASGLPYTIQRATQFHDLIARFFAVQRWSPVTVVARRFRFQPIHTRDVARRLGELVAGDPVGMAPDIGGPDVIGMDRLARMHHDAHGGRGRGRVVRVPLPGSIATGFAAGWNLTPANAVGTIGFEQFLAEHVTRGEA
ncbi:SDR family oxidoreductase [Brachybacterium sp. FME24]|uniref:SDR family oxidoreductase n=1 Tax=Brachybacterium sp. FME24 TaxID=2742605 RepID=UPI001865AB9D|nr:NAD(P)H-binding protein [Brachybacterium sp. FME24]